MKRIVKILLGLVLVLVVLLIAAGIAFKILADPENLKARVMTLVKEQTGRELVIAGDLSLTFFPWVGFDIGDAALKNPPGFTDADMLSFESASATVRLLPLMGKQIEVGGLELSGLTLSLEKRADGATNWDDLLAAFDSERDAAAEPADDGGFSPTGLGGVDVRNAKVRWRDAEAGSDYQITELNFSTGAIAPGKSVPVELSFNALSESPQVAFTANLETTFLPEAANAYSFEATDLTVTGNGENLPGDEITLSLKGEGGNWKGEDAQVIKPVISVTTKNDASLGDAGLSLEAGQMVYKVQTGSIRFDGPKGKIQSSKLGANLDLKAVNVASRFSTQSLQFAKLDIGGTLDLTGSGASPVKLTAEEFRTVVTAQLLILKDVKMDVLGMHIETDLEANKILESPRFRGSLAIDSFSPRAVMEGLGQAVPVTADPEVFKTAAFKTTMGINENSGAFRNIELRLDDTTVTGNIVLRNIAQRIYDVDLNVDQINVDRYLAPASEEVSTSEEPTLIPVEPLQNKVLTGKLKIGEFIVAGLKATNVDLGLNIQNDQFRLNPARANMYGGLYTGNLVLNVSGPKPVLSMNQNIANIQMKPFSQDMTGSELMTGVGGGSVVLRATGVDLDEIKRTADGTIRFKVTDGAYPGVNIWYEMQRAAALIEKRPAPEKTSNQTDFKDLHGNAMVKSGVMSTNDMIADLGFAKAEISGQVRLPTDEVDLQVTASVSEVPRNATAEDEATMRSLDCFAFSAKVGGTTSAPTVRPDIQKSAADWVECKGKKKVDDLIDKETDKLKDRLRGILRGDED